MLRLFLVVAVVASAHGQCNNDVAVANGNFEQSADEIFAGNYNRHVYLGDNLPQIPGWFAEGRVVWLGTRSRAWGIQYVNDEGMRFPDGYVTALQKSQPDRACAGCISNEPGSIEQTITGLVPGDPYQISMAAAKRPTYHPEYQKFTVLVGGAVLAANVVPEYYFSQHTFGFTAGSTTAVIKIMNTSPLVGPSGPNGAIDHTVFLDNVTVCHLGSTTTTTTASSTTTTATATTHTAFEDVNRELNELRSMMVASQWAQSRMQSRMDAMAGSLSAADAAAAATAEVGARVTDLTNVIRRAVTVLPNPPFGVDDGGGSRDPPAIMATGNDITVRAGGDVTIETGTCGVLNPCDILAALNALREVV